MMPLIATTDAVISVAQATTRVRRRAVSTPSARASSSGSASRFMRQRKSSIGASPARARGAATTRSVDEIDDRLPSSQKVIAGNWLYGSARYLSSAITEPSSEPITTPVRTSARSGSWPRNREATAYTRPTAAMPPTKARI